MIDIQEKYIRIDTLHTTLLLDTEDEIPQYLYYGEKLPAKTLPDLSLLKPERERTGVNLNRQLLSFFGRGDYRESSLLIENADGSFVNRFVFTGAQPCEKPSFPNLPAAHTSECTVKISLYDSCAEIYCNVYFTTYADTDALTVSTELQNAGTRPVTVFKLASLQLDLNGKDYLVTTFDGSWAAERRRHDRPVPDGLFINQSRTGSSSALHSPMLLVSDKSGIFGFNLLWSGNHKESVESCAFRLTRIIVGENDFLYRVRLDGGERVLSPEAVMCRAEKDDDLTEQMHTFVNRHILPPRFRALPRPVLLNSWEGCGFRFDGEKILSMAKKARRLGAELFVLDDGWFGNRNDDTSSLGDWTANAEKTGGLAPLSARIRRLGLKFGIWIEPEMISENSDLFRAHPEYAMTVPGRSPYRHRNQLMLDITLPAVKRFVIESVSSVIRESHADYVKWDYNRNMTDLPSDRGASVHYFRRYILSLYEIFAEVTRRFPEVLFEGCAAGGGRFDLGILCFMPQIWTSDNTDARERLEIQFNTARLFPQSTMGAHVSACPNSFTGNSTPLETRFNTACGGNLGYELDPEKLSEKDCGTILRQIRFYKKYRNLLQFGKYYLLESAHDAQTCGYLAVSPRKDRAIGCIFLKNKQTGIGNFRFSFKGLRPDFLYLVSERPQENYTTARTFTATGAMLMHGEINTDGIFEDTQSVLNSNSMFSRMFVLRKIVRTGKN